MASIDERVVSMAFENSVFEQKVSVTMSTLSKLDVAIKNIGQVNGLSNIEKDANKVTLAQPLSALDKLKGKFGFVREAQQAFSGVEAAANKVTLSGVNTAIDKTAGHLSVISQAAARVDISGLGRGIDTVVNGFSVLEGAASVAFGSIAAKAAIAGASAIKSLSLGPITQGFAEYATNLNSIQTILANTQQDGSNLQDVNAALQQLNTYSDQTIYNFSQMAKNIGTFTAAGVKLGPATESIKGIANLAALSGSTADQASSAMYQLSQAIAAGKVNLQDWNSVVNSGMGGKVFQKALFDTGKAMGTITNSPVGQTFAQWEKAGNSFRQSLSATQKAATDGTSALKKAQTDSSKSIADAQSNAADAVASAGDRVKSAQSSAADAVVAAAKKVRDAEQTAADDVAAAAEKVKTAQKDVADASKKASDDIRAAVAAQRESIKQSAADVKSALDAVVVARQRLADAMKPPSADELQAATDNLKTAQLDQADLAGAITDAQTEQKRSAEDLASAQQNLIDLQKNGGNAAQIQAAARAVEDAQKRAADATDAVERAILRQNAATRGLHDAEKNLLDTQQKGTDQDKNVKDARDGLTKATNDYRDAQIKARKEVVDAEKNVADVRKKSAEAQKAAGDRLAQAEKDQARTQVKARESVAQAEKDQAKVIIDSRKSVADAEKAQAKVIKDSRASVADAVEQAAARIKAARDSVSGGKGPPSWLTSDVLTNTLRQFTGDMTTAQLKAQGFTDEQIKAIQQTAKTAKESATQVKTLGQLFSVVKESIGSGWAKTFQIIFGDFGEAKKTFTTLSNYITGFVNGLSKARNKVLGDWKILGGRAKLIEGLKNAFKALMGFIKPFKDAFRDIFPATSGKNLFDLTKKFADFTKGLIPGQKTIDNLRRTFRGFFALLHIGWTIVKDVAGVIFDLLGVVGKGSGGFLNFTGGIGDMVVALDNALTKGGLLKAFFKGLTAIIKLPLAAIKNLVGAIASLFGGDNTKKSGEFASSMDQVKKALGPLSGVADKVVSAWNRVLDIFSKIKDFVSPFIQSVGDALSGIGDAIANTFRNIDMNKVLLALQTGLIGGIFLYLKKVFSKGLGIDIGGGAIAKLGKTFDALTGNLKAMQQNVKAGTLLKIGAAIAVLAAAVFVLSTIEPNKLNKAMTAVAVGLVEMVTAMSLLGKIGGAGAFIQLPLLAAGLVLLATSVVILAGAMKIMATMNWEQIAKGLAGIAGALVAVGIGMKFIGATRIIPIAAGLVLVGVALNIIAVAMKQFATMKWQEIGKGLVGIAGALTAVGLGLKLIGPSILLVGPGLIAAAIGIGLLSVAVKSFGKMDLKTLAKGILGAAAAVAALGFATALLPPTLALQAAGLIVLGVGLTALAGAVAIFGKMKITTIVKGIGAMAAALVVLAVGLDLMTTTVPGTLALLGAAAALAVLAPTLAFLGTLKWSTIFKGLAAIALTLGVLAVGGLLAAPALLALGVALTVLGAALLVIAAAVYLASKGIALMGEAGPKAFAALVVAITAFVALIPTMVINFVKGLVAIIEEIAKVAPKVAIAIGTIIDTFLAIIIEAAPKVALAVGALADAFVTVIVEHSAQIIAAGLTLLVNFLSGIANNIGRVTTAVGNIVINFLNALKVKLPEIIAAGVGVLVSFLAGIVKSLPQVIARASQVVTTFLAEITRRLPDVIAKGARLIVVFLTSLSSHLPAVIAAGVKVIVAIIDGIGNALPRIIGAGTRVVKKLLAGIAVAIPDLVDAGFKMVIKILNGIANAIRANDDQLIAAGHNIAGALKDGFIKGIQSFLPDVSGFINDIGNLLPKGLRKKLGIASPSKVFQEIGIQTMAGLTLGLQQGGEDTKAAVQTAGQDVIDTAGKTLGQIPDMLSGMVNVNPVITPVLDLTEVELGAKRLDGLVNPNSVLVPTASIGAANNISAQQAANQTGNQDPGLNPNQQVVTLNQYNTSPESLSDTEIYRQTKNQISQLRHVLGVPGPGFAA